MDMSKVGVSDSTGQPLFLSTQGKLVEFEDSHPCGNSDSNYIVLRAQERFFFSSIIISIDTRSTRCCPGVRATRGHEIRADRSRLSRVASRSAKSIRPG